MTVKTSNPEIALPELNRTYFVAKEGGETFVYEKMTDPWADPSRPRQCLQQLTFDAFREWESNQLVEDRDTIQKRGDWWLRHPLRRQYREIRLLPYGSTPAEVFNLWNGFAAKPREGNWSRFRHFLKNVICGGSEALFEWLIFWMARAVQRPAEHASTALYVRGEMGAAQNILADVMANIWGQHFAEVRDHRHISPPCNARLRDCVMLFVDFRGTLHQPGAINRLTQLTQEPQIPIESVGGKQVRVPNHLHLIISNELSPLPAGLRASDFQTFSVDGSSLSDREIRLLQDQLFKEGGLGALLYDLSRIEVPEREGISCKHLESREDQIVAGMSAIDRWWYECLFRRAIIGSGAESSRWQGAAWPAADEPVNREVLFGAFVWYCTNILGTQPRVSYQALWARLAKLKCTLITPARSAHGGSRYWLFPCIQAAREGLCKSYGHRFRWPD